MTNMFKKTLIATAVLGFAGTATAAEIDTTPKWFASELLQNAPLTSGLATDADLNTALTFTFTYTMKANYTVNDTVAFTFTGNAVSASTIPSAIDNSEADAENFVELSLISTETVDGNLVATYRVTTIGASVTSTIDETFEVAGVKVLPRNLTGALRVSYKALTAFGQTLDTAGDADKQNPVLANVASQFASLAVEEGEDFSATIDVEAERKQFTGDDPELVYSVKNGLPSGASFAADGDASVTNVTYTINGNFGWLLDSDGDEDADVGELKVTGCTDEANREVAADKFTIRCNGLSAPTFTVDINAENAVVIPDQKFTVSAVVAYSAAGANQTKSLSAVNAGEWDLNGSKVVIPYMLYGANAEQTIQLTNLGTQSGDITVTATVGGQTLELGSVGTAGKESVNSINAAIRTAMINKGVNLNVPNFAVGLTLVTNVPKEDVQVYSAYRRTNAASDSGRQVVVNTSNGAK